MATGLLSAFVALSGGAFVAALFAALSSHPGPGGAPTVRRTDAPAPLLFRLLEPLLGVVAAHVRRLGLGGVRGAVERLRIRAGEPLGLDADEVLALCGLGLAAGALAGAVLAGSLGLAGGLALTAAMASYPIVWLRSRARTRLAGLDRSLAYANDLLVLSLEAGADLVGAIRQYVSGTANAPDPLPYEFARVLKDLELGSTRRAAMEAFAARAPSEAVKGFVVAVVQAEQRGTPLTQALRIQAVALRTARSQRIEVRAGRASVLVMLPLVLIFAATVLLVFGGVIVRAMRGELM